MSAAAPTLVPASTRDEPWVADVVRLLPPWVHTDFDTETGSLRAVVGRHLELRVWPIGAPEHPHCAQVLETDANGHWVRAGTTWGETVELALGRMSELAPTYGFQLPIGADRPLFPQRSTETSA